MAISNKLTSPDAQCIPTKADIIKISTRYTTYAGTKKVQANGINVPWIATPWGLANSIQDSHKKLRYFFVSLLLGWDELAEKLKEVLKKDGYTAADMKVFQDYITANLDKFEADLDQYALTENLDEDIEKHEELNPKLFTNNNLISEVRTKLLEIADTFEEELLSNGIAITVKDIIIIGSNVSYNYTKDSDLDLHIIADPSALDCPEDLSQALYSAYRSIFNNKLDINFYGIPVEIFVETDSINTISNGIYSVLDNKWIKEPVITNIPELDQEAFDKTYLQWEKIYKALKDKVNKDELSDETEVLQLIEDIYNLRKTGLSSDGEYSIGNLVFKELRNKGYLDDLKNMRDQLVSKRLSLQEELTSKKLDDASKIIAKTIHRHVWMRDNGYFTVEDIETRDIDLLMARLRGLDCIKSVEKRDGGYDSRYSGYGRPTKFYHIIGQIKDEE